VSVSEQQILRRFAPQDDKPRDAGVTKAMAGRYESPVVSGR